MLYVWVGEEECESSPWAEWAVAVVVGPQRWPAVGAFADTRPVVVLVHGAWVLPRRSAAMGALTRDVAFSRQVVAVVAEAVLRGSRRRIFARARAASGAGTAALSRRHCERTACTQYQQYFAGETRSCEILGRIWPRRRR